MAVYALTNCALFVGGWSLGGRANKIDLKHSVNELDVTTFGNTFKQRIGGLADIDVSADGFLDYAAGSPSNTQTNFPPGSSQVISIGPVNGTPGSPAMVCTALDCDITMAAQVGEVAKFTLAAKGQGALGSQGIILTDGIFAASTSGTSYQWNTPPGAAQHFYANTHILSLSGTAPTVTITYASSPTQGGTYVTRYNTAAYGAVGAYAIPPQPGPITDTWWRASITLGGTSPAAALFVAIGVGP